MIPYTRQSIDESDIAAVTDVLRSDWLTCGPKVAEFEKQFADFVGAKHAVAVNSGTAALHLAMAAAEIGPGNRVITSPNTFLASANCAAYVGATPDFCDIDPITHNLCPISLGENWKSDTQAVVAVDYAGQSADMPAIANVARSRGAIVIEDACHAVGGQFSHAGEGWKIGGHPWADMTTFSFHPAKTMTTGEGGMLVTDNDTYADRARCLRTHGMIRDPDRFTGLVDVSPSPHGKESGGSDAADRCSRTPHEMHAAINECGTWSYEMQELGFNYRMSDFQCALGLNQLSRVPQFVARRREIVKKYNDNLKHLDSVATPQLRNHLDKDRISWHLYTLRVNFSAIEKTRSQVMEELRSEGVGTQVLYIPVYLQPWYRRTYGYSLGKCPIAESYYQQSLSLPLFPSMTNDDINTVLQSVQRVLRRSGRKAVTTVDSLCETFAHEVFES